MVFGEKDLGLKGFSVWDHSNWTFLYEEVEFGLFKELFNKIGEKPSSDTGQRILKFGEWWAFIIFSEFFCFFFEILVKLGVIQTFRFFGWVKVFFLNIFCDLFEFNENGEELRDFLVVDIQDTQKEFFRLKIVWVPACL